MVGFFTVIDVIWSCQTHYLSALNLNSVN